ncbi:MAG: S8 family peptidase [Ignavibacteriales bacterium]|nr:S8 family peptidase [Ignavibacteriales bacterium]
MNRASATTGLLMFLLVFLSFEGFGQSHYWVFLKNRSGVSAPAPGELGITDRAIHRRSKVLPSARLIDELDLPPPQSFLNELKSAGIQIRAVSRWLNAVSVDARQEQLEAVRKLASVDRIEPVGFSRKHEPLISPLPETPLPKIEQSTLSYGPSLLQVRTIKVVDVHDLAINGAGVLVGMIDDGFNNHRTHEALKNIAVLAEYDFINRDSTTSVQPGETDGGGAHGQATLSVLAGYMPDKLIGPAFGATLMLAKTEVGSFEEPVEEDYYVEALEWMERTGADVISSSLGYCDWYTYSQMDGQTAVTSIAAGVAARKGVLVVTAMGNTSGACFRNLKGELALVAPADADSIVSVGAMYSFMELADFSLPGPTADGRIKPEVIAQGVSVVSAAGPSASYGSGNGTSFSTPLVAGVAALILSAHPDLTPMQVRAALMNTAVQVNDPPRTATWPNNYYGWGIVNAIDAVLYHGMVFSNVPLVKLDDSTLTVATFIQSPSPLTTDSLFLHYQPSSGSAFQRVPLTWTPTPNLFRTSIPVNADIAYPRGYFSARDASGNVRMYPPGAPDSLFNLRSLVNANIPGYPDFSPTSYVLYQNYPNPFNSGTTIVFDAPSRDPVELVIYNLLGQRIRSIVHNNPVIGPNSVFWDGLNDTGRPVSSGVYIARLQNSQIALTQKMLLIR